ncbi:hypothetical protein PMAYCL1PPCAC_05959 [Pristionchus mayeri]|uniref:F-box domain-containing protein n=1 Tax=Pristionchus mayeri TaxID=1317129 RepID=A0AAN5CB85_9BILA|nr:hypothetical protein PMAYCL1PPCAC_05959 [Pristionchus mayeri]
MEAKILTDLPCELITQIVSNLHLHDKLHFRLSSRFLNALVITETKTDVCELVSLNIQQLKNNLHISAEMANGETALHFVNIASKASQIQPRRISTGGKELLLRFSSFDNSQRDFDLFEKAHIAHFRVGKRMPFYLTADNVEWLKQVLTGSTIDNCSLVIDAMTAPQIEIIPSLLALTRVKNVEFIVQNIHECDMLERFRESEFASNMVTTEVQEISFIGDNIFGKRLGGFSETKTDFALIEQLLNSGIRKVKMEFDGLERDGFERFQLKPFLRHLSLSSHDAEIVIKNRIPIESGTRVYRMGRNYSRFLVTANKSGRNFTYDEVHITTLKDDENPLLVSIDL